MTITIKDALKALHIAAEQSPQGYDTEIALCEKDRDYDYFKDVALEINDDLDARFLFSLHKFKGKQNNWNRKINGLWVTDFRIIDKTDEELNKNSV